MKTNKTSFSAQSRLTKKLCTDSAKYMIWHNKVFMLFICIGVILTLTLPFYMIMGYSFSGAFAANVGFLPGLGLLAIIVYAPYYMGKKIYQRSGEKIIKMTFNDEKVIVNNNGRVSLIKYDSIKKYSCTDKYIFITTKRPDMVVYVLEKNNFKDNELEDFISFFKEKIK